MSFLVLLVADGPWKTEEDGKASISTTGPGSGTFHHV
jgi:hypothetical protein